MHYGNIKKTDIANGYGVRVTLFVSGCTNRCEGCFQPETWDFNYGEEYTEKTEEELLMALGRPGIAGLTLLGGEPFEPSNQRVLVQLLTKVKEKYPTKDVWCYTGSLYEDLIDKNNPKHCEVTNEMLHLIDVLVDGPFVESLKDLNLMFRGSSNQRIINMNRMQENRLR